MFENLNSNEKKVLTWAGIELGSPRLPVRRADHSANRQIFFKKFILFNPVSNRQIGNVKKKTTNNEINCLRAVIHGVSHALKMIVVVGGGGRFTQGHLAMKLAVF